MPGVFAFAETREGELHKVAHEVISAARTVADEMGAEVHAVMLGPPAVAGAAGELGTYGADKIFVGTSDAFEHYSAEGYTTVLTGFIQEHGCDVALFPATALGKDLAPRVAARLGAGYAAECTELAVSDGALVATRPMYAGKAIAEMGFPDKPAVASLRPNAFPTVEKQAAGEVQTLDIGLNAGDFGAIVREVRAAAGEKLDVAEASIIVSGGRGLREPENFKLLEELADALGGAAVGASRAVVDAGWRPHAEQVGQTGKTVAPTLYFAIGISGAIQHLAGMRTSKYIVAINKDPEAPIFKVADYGIVGDLFEIVPRLTEEIRKMK